MQVDCHPDKCEGCLVCKAAKHPEYPRPKCNQSHFVYILKCTECGLEYVGETEQPFSDRLARHLNTAAAERYLQQNQQQRNRNADSNTPGPSIFAQHICKDHAGKEAADCCAIGMVAKTKSYGHRKCAEGGFHYVNRCGWNLRAGGGQGIARLR